MNRQLNNPNPTTKRGMSGTSFVCLAMFLVGPSQATAEVFSTARTLPTGRIMLGIEPQVTPAEGPFYELFLHGGVGMTSGTDFSMKLGLPLRPDGPMYLGGEVQIALLNDGQGSPGISVILGGHGHGWDRFGLDAALVLSNDFGRFEPMLAVDTDLEFTGNTLHPSLRLVPGLMVDISNVTRFNVELGVAMSDGASTFVSCGFQFLL